MVAFDEIKCPWSLAKTVGCQYLGTLTIFMSLLDKDKEDEFLPMKYPSMPPVTKPLGPQRQHKMPLCALCVRMEQ